MSTGSRGYFGYAGSLSPRSHIENTEPRSERINRWYTHESHNPRSFKQLASEEVAEGICGVTNIVLAVRGGNEAGLEL